MGWEPVKCRIPDLLVAIDKDRSWLRERTKFSRSYINDTIHLKLIPGLVNAKIYAAALGCKIDDLHVWEYVRDTGSE